jgi:YbbR domain-containing protein
VIKRTLPVTVRLSGKPADGYRVTQTVASPENVSVQGPAEEVRRLTAIETLPLDVEESRGGVKRRVRLSNDNKPLTITPDQVEVAVSIEEERVTREFDKVEVRAKDFKGTYTVTPSSAHLQLSGPKSVMAGLKLSAENVYLDLRGMTAGEHSVVLSFHLPPDVKVVEQKPQRFRVRVVKPAE